MGDNWYCTWIYLDEEGNETQHKHKTHFEHPPMYIEEYVSSMLRNGEIDEAEAEYISNLYQDVSPVPNKIYFEGVIDPTLQQLEQDKPQHVEHLQDFSKKKSPSNNSLPPPPPPKSQNKSKSGKKSLPPPPPPAKKKLKEKDGTSNKDGKLKRFSFGKEEAIKTNPTWKYGPKHIPSGCTKTNNTFNTIVYSNEAPIRFEMAAPSSGEAKIVFLIDTSGSMGNEMEAVKKTCLGFADHIVVEGKANVQLSLVAYDIGSPRGPFPPEAILKSHSGSPSDYNTIAWPLMDAIDFHDTVDKLLKVGMGGGSGCYVANTGTAKVFEECIRVLKSSRTTKSNSKADANSTDFIVHISDEVGGTADVSKIVSLCKASDVIVHTMGCNRPGHTSISEQTNGTFWDIAKTQGKGELSGILSEVSAVIAKAVALNKTTQKSKHSKIEGPSCRYTDSAPRYIQTTKTHSEGGVGQFKEMYDAEEGWLRIDDWRCKYCESDDYAKCPTCHVHLCFGGVRISGSEYLIQCTDCKWEGEIEYSETVASSGGSGNAGKGKGK